jgi:GxxExxY protein
MVGNENLRKDPGFPSHSGSGSLSENEISTLIVGAAIEVHRALGGPGLLESVYEEALAYELEAQGLNVNRQVVFPIFYKGHQLSSNLRIDLLANKKVIIECKSTQDYNSIFETQILTYLRLTGLKLGLIINFGERLVKNGVKRVVNGLDSPAGQHSLSEPKK